MKQNQALELIAYIEEQLFFFYQMTPNWRAQDYLLSDEARACFVSDRKLEEHSEGASRAALWLLREDDDELFVGIHFEAELFEALEQAPPLRQLTHHNLDVFCVFVEELSHFHLVGQRLGGGRTVSQLELEWQAEIDKALLSAVVLSQQSGRTHLPQLIRKLYGEVSFTNAANTDRYREANQYAAKFWQRAIDLGLGESATLYSRRFLTMLRQNYHKPLEEKFPFSLHHQKSA